MSKYNYLYERPRVDHAASEKLTDFDEVFSRVNQTRRYFLIRNTALITLVISAGIFSLIFFNHDRKIATGQNVDSVFSGNTDKQIIENKAPEPEEHQQNLQPVISGKANQKPEENRKTPKGDNTSEHHTSDDHFKIKETMPEKPAFVQAEPKEGFQRLFEYFNKNTPYPDSLKLKKIEGKVLVEFVVLKDGRIDNVKVIQKLHPVLDSIAISSVKHMPGWKPATMNNAPVATSHTVPLFFQIDNQ